MAKHWGKCVDCDTPIFIRTHRKRCASCLTLERSLRGGRYRADRTLADSSPIWEAKFWHKLLKKGKMSLAEIENTLSGVTPYRVATQKEFEKLVNG